jgi:hypothetical protein
VVPGVVNAAETVALNEPAPFCPPVIETVAGVATPEMPSLVDEPVDGDALVPVDEQECEQRPLLSAGKREHLACPRDLERAENAKIEPLAEVDSSASRQRCYRGVADPARHRRDEPSGRPRRSQ